MSSVVSLGTGLSDCEHTHCWMAVHTLYGTDIVTVLKLSPAQSFRRRPYLCTSASMNLPITADS